ncbi:MAG TPA: peroxiredoxin [Nitrospiria bacterium]|jgi:alkyl hydroperoxide reductase subunit AhpC
MLTIGDPAPDFSLKGVYQEKIKTYTLKEKRGKWLVLFFYPADFTFICPTEVVGFSEKSNLFQSEGAQIYGISIDPVESHQSWAKELGGISYPLLADPEKKTAMAFHVLHPSEEVALRATFIIDGDGIIQHSTASHMNVGRSVEETLRVFQALRTGRLCPAGWNPGDPTGNLEHKY